MVATAGCYALQLLSGGRLVALGCAHSASVFKGQVWRLVTPIFLHSPGWFGPIHLLSNCAALNALGPELERRMRASAGNPFGPRAAAAERHRFASLYIASGVAGNLLSLTSKIPGVGASGAVCGVLGALIIHAESRGGQGGGNTNSYSTRNFDNLYANAMIALAVGLLPFVNGAAHLGGLMGGAAMYFQGLGERQKSGVKLGAMRRHAAHAAQRLVSGR